MAGLIFQTAITRILPIPAILLGVYRQYTQASNFIDGKYRWENPHTGGTRMGYRVLYIAITVALLVSRFRREPLD